MPSIITLTLSPCIDKSTFIDSLLPEKKLRCSPPFLEPGGGGINVARALKKLGKAATAVFPSGGCNGVVFNTLLQKEEILSLIINTTNETRENIIVFDKSTNNQYRFGIPATSLLQTEWQECLKKVEELNTTEFIIASGSLPSGVPLDIYAQLAKIAKTNKAKLIVDTSGEALLQAINEGVYLIKPNLGELALLVNKKEFANDEEIKNAAHEIIHTKKCQIVVVSMGAKGAMLVTKNKTTLIKPPKIIALSTVGAGDSMVAGIVFYLLHNKTIVDAVKYGVACGTAATMNAGTQLCKKEDADLLYQQILITELS
jgi:6-phosphofructokinase 2